MVHLDKSTNFAPGQFIRSQHHRQVSNQALSMCFARKIVYRCSLQDTSMYAFCDAFRVSDIFREALEYYDRVIWNHDVTTSYDIVKWL
jgi:hypothetical protein